jgi:hypothetical protein
MSGSGKQPEPEEDSHGLLYTFGQFTKDAKFECDENRVEKYTDPRLKEKARQLFKALGFEDLINSKKMSCSVLRLRPGKSSLGAHYAVLFPVNVGGNSPIIDGKEVDVGEWQHITDGGTIQVREDSAVDLLYTIEKKEKKK